MVPGRHIPTNGLKAHIDKTEGNLRLKSERLPEPVPDCGGNAIDPDLISSQPLPAAVPVHSAVTVKEPQKHQSSQSQSKSRPSCPQCGLQIPEHKHLRGAGGSSVSVHSKNSKKSRSKADSTAHLNQPAANTNRDVCFDLLLSCLFCHCSALLVGLLELCSSGLSSLCLGCGEGCVHCCCSGQGPPVEELSCHTHCHSVLVQSCCEPIECLEFCLECCQICHRS
ncbi:hypothetical protein NL108_016045 [Boleophthalmus pectinirostris]|uniref:myoD family inhibitor domain-containing protein-like n=1 Tax=Boleophthalmus pectinirostris TaxID=150288 RepID=UPI0024329A93|nr:myoD family inhibitor domain-containing protein-like [Boleophthalmus pectinirostris]KAJ0069883.1 hypothetical protein NL108_016045 [Boleophthalmus pectinirostris]